MDYPGLKLSIHRLGRALNWKRFIKISKKLTKVSKTSRISANYPNNWRMKKFCGEKRLQPPRIQTEALKSSKKTFEKETVKLGFPIFHSELLIPLRIRLPQR